MKNFVVPPQVRRQAHPLHATQIEVALGPLAGGIYQPGVPGLLLLCFTNRCGSNHLAALLASTGAFNSAGEFFNFGTVIRHAKSRGLTGLRDYVSILPKLVRNVGAWLVAKASLDQLVMLADAGILAAHPRVHFILIERQDLLAQAISRCIAAQNSRWIATDDAEIPDSAIVYDRAAIAYTLHEVAQTNAGFRAFFAANGLAPIHFVHEQIVADPQAAISRIGAALELPALRLGPIDLMPQASPLNAEWRARFEAGE